MFDISFFNDWSNVRLKTGFDMKGQGFDMKTHSHQYHLR